MKKRGLVISIPDVGLVVRMSSGKPIFIADQSSAEQYVGKNVLFNLNRHKEANELELASPLEEFKYQGTLYGTVKDNQLSLKLDSQVIGSLSLDELDALKEYEKLFKKKFIEVGNDGKILLKDTELKKQQAFVLTFEPENSTPVYKISINGIFATRTTANAPLMVFFGNKFDVDFRKHVDPQWKKGKDIKREKLVEYHDILVAPKPSTRFHDDAEEVAASTKSAHDYISKIVDDLTQLPKSKEWSDNFVNEQDAISASNKIKIIANKLADLLAEFKTNK